MLDELATKQDLLLLKTRLTHDLTASIAILLAAGFALMPLALKALH